MPVGASVRTQAPQHGACESQACAVELHLDGSGLEYERALRAWIGRGCPWCHSCCHVFSVQGLSHYLEHMLFMGSEKFPDENEYDAFLTNNAGSSNAYTELVRASCPGSAPAC